MRPILRLTLHLLIGLGLGFAINHTLRSDSTELPNGVVHQSLSERPKTKPAAPRFDPRAIAHEIAGLAEASDRPRARLLLEQRLLAQAQRSGQSDLEHLIQAIDTPNGQGSAELQSFLVFLLRRIAEENPARALELVQNLANAQLRASTFGTIARGWAERDPRAFLEYAESSPPGIVRSRGTYIAIDHLAKSDPRGALDYALAADGFVFNLNVFGNVFKNWFRTDADAAEQWLLHGGSPNDRKRIHAGAIHAYIDMNPSGAVAFIDRLPADREPAFWRRVAIGKWASSDPVAALNAIQEMPPGQVTERLLHEFAQRASWNSPESVLEYAKSLDLTDPQANAAYLSGAINPEVLPEIREAAALATELPEGKWRSRSIRQRHLPLVR